ncbi:radical SAM protein [Sulfolobus acidocaldarius SUSAZ]|nr:radical SAM protein [Sulfolobus acidocaldarius SUSAZ]
MKYWIIEIFTSIQGEGEVIGTPSNFVRLAGCHMRCVWCDTKYSWHKYDGKELSIQEIISKINVSVKTTTITGGEPLLQDIIPLAEELKKLEQRIVVETSGTIKPNQKLRELIDVFSVSPKLSNAGYRLKYNFKDDDWATYYKFVIVNPKTDIPEVIKFVEENRIDHRKVLLQPDGRRNDYVNALKELADSVMEFGLQFRVLPQLHRIISYR